MGVRLLRPPRLRRFLRHPARARVRGDLQRLRDRSRLLRKLCLLLALAGCLSTSYVAKEGGPGARPVAEPPPAWNTEAYARIDENPFLSATSNPLSTFSIDVDTASYSNVRRFLRDGALPPRDAVRIEELVHYFPYADPPPSGTEPFALRLEAAPCPWRPEHRLLRIALKAREIDWRGRPPSNLVLLVDVSGSMNAPDKLPLVKQGLRLLVQGLTENDRVAIVVYAGAEGLALPPTPGDRGEEILAALDRLEAGGSTNGGAGIRLAYRVAKEGFRKGGVNRVILATDGDFNVGTTSEGELTRLIEDEARSGVFLTVLGVGTGNLKDSTMEKLADRGNGNYAYVDSANEARRVLVEQASGTLLTVAKDVKIQVEFNPARVEAYRLLGYENRLLRAEDFNDDRKDAGEMGAGHTVTAFYEIVPKGTSIGLPPVDPPKYGPARAEPAASGDEMLTVKARYKDPEGDASRRIDVPFTDRGATLEQASSEFRFAAAVACWGLLLRQSEHRGGANFGLVRELAAPAVGADPGGYRREFLSLVERSRGLER
jgi:Ca-activated chloride channel family protein